MESSEIKDIQKVLPYFLKHKTLWSSYDDEADVLYLHFKKPNHADESEMVENDIIIRYEKDEVVGLTVLNASQFG
jgi:uncharacterized protein YuzE